MGTRARSGRTSGTALPWLNVRVVLLLQLKNGGSSGITNVCRLDLMRIFYESKTAGFETQDPGRMAGAD